MANPPNAVTMAQPLAPGDIKDFAVNISQMATSSDGQKVLQQGESVTSFTIATTAEAAAAGLQIQNTGGMAAAIVGNQLTYWLGVASANQGSSSFAGTGIALGVVVTLTTNASPPRTIQKTIVHKVANQ